MMWFIRESKSYMGYGQTISKLEFWVRFPGAAFRYWRLAHEA